MKFGFFPKVKIQKLIVSYDKNSYKRETLSLLIYSFWLWAAAIFDHSSADGIKK